MVNKNGFDVDISLYVECVRCADSVTFGGPRWHAGKPLPKFWTRGLPLPEGWVTLNTRPYCPKHVPPEAHHEAAN